MPVTLKRSKTSGGKAVPTKTETTPQKTGLLPAGAKGAGGVGGVATPGTLTKRKIWDASKSSLSSSEAAAKASLEKKAQMTRLRTPYSRNAWFFGFKLEGSIAKMNIYNNKQSTHYDTCSFMVRDRSLKFIDLGYNGDTSKRILKIVITDQPEVKNHVLSFAKNYLQLFWEYTKEGFQMTSPNDSDFDKKAKKWRKSVLTNFDDVYDCGRDEASVLECLKTKHEQEFPGEPTPEGFELVWKMRDDPGFMDGTTSTLIKIYIEKKGDDDVLVADAYPDNPVTLPYKDDAGKKATKQITVADLRAGDTFKQAYFRMCPNVKPGSVATPSMKIILVTGANPREYFQAFLMPTRGEESMRDMTPEQKEKKKAQVAEGEVSVAQKTEATLMDSVWD